MTPAETLQAAVEARDEEAIRNQLADLPEAERASLLEAARAIVKGIRGVEAFGKDLTPSVLVAYGVLPVSDIRALGWRAGHLPKGLVDVLRLRSQERLGPIVDYLIDEHGLAAWPAVRALVREGIVARPDRPSYTIAMLAANRYRSAAEVVAEDPGLLEVEIWRLFEVEGGGEDSLAAHEKYTGDRWGDLFRELATSDPAIRARLLDASLAALARDFGAFRAGWFSRFHESLKPTSAERAARRDAYLGLLRSRVGPTVSFAVAALAAIDERLPAEELLGRIGPVLAEAPAGTARAAIDLVRRAGSPAPQAARAAAIVTAQAFANRSPDVQRVALAAIDWLVSEPDADVARVIADRLPEVAASQRKTAQGLIERLGGVGDVPARPVDPSEPTQTPSPPASPIEHSREVHAIETLDQLVDIAVSVLERGEPADDLERVLDAVGRVGPVRSPEFGRLTAPIAKRARTILARRETFALGGLDARGDIAAVLLSWTTGEVVPARAAPRAVDPGTGGFLSARAREVAEAAAHGEQFLSVAAPTHRGGWIDPAALVTRLRDRPPASRLDFVAAILRLASDGREVALRAAADVAGEPGDVLRYALGGEESVGPTAAWWVAAARVRSPGEDDLAVERRHPGLGPGAGTAARARLVLRDPRRFMGGLALELEPPMNPDVGTDLPTVLMFRDHSSFFWSGRSEPAMFRWMAVIQPGDREAWAATGSVLLGRNVDWWSAEWANRVFLEPYLESFTTIGPHGRGLLAIALGAKEAGERGLATDIVAIALQDGRLGPGELAEGLRAAAAVALDRPIRWAASLAEVAAGSSPRAAMVAEAIGRALPAIGHRPTAALVPVLRLLDELLAATNGAVADDARPPLTKLAGGGGQGGRLARSILVRNAKTVLMEP
jgi:hypothetical protein